MDVLAPLVEYNIQHVGSDDLFFWLHVSAYRCHCLTFIFSSTCEIIFGGGGGGGASLLLITPINVRLPYAPPPNFGCNI